MFKQFLKDVYMHLCHPLVFLRGVQIGKHCYIGKHARMKKLQYLSMGNACRIGNDFRLAFYDTFYGEKYHPSLKLGNQVYITDHFTVLCADKIEIEDDVLMASYITITSENHGMDPEAEVCYAKQPLSTRPVYIREGAWIGERVVILPGVEIGKKSIVAAGSVVTKSVPAYSVAAGNPARVIKQYDFKEHKWKRVTHGKAE